MSDLCPPNAFMEITHTSLSVRNQGWHLAAGEVAPRCSFLYLQKVQAAHAKANKGLFMK